MIYGLLRCGFATPCNDKIKADSAIRRISQEIQKNAESSKKFAKICRIYRRI
ncbi:hypothetical protein [Helicobacter sp. 23-1045]